MASWKKDWEMTQAAFDKLLAQLHPDIERAQLEYENIRAGLIQFFEYKGCSMSTDLTDETINRAARRILEGVVIQAGRVVGYFRTIAHHVLQEYWRSSDATSVPVDEQLLPPHLVHDPRELTERLAAQQAQERRLECLRRCLDKLPPETRRVIFAYYEGDEGQKIANRKQLADELNMPISLLRLHAHRIRKKLETCVTKCCKAAE
jgi:DNA-directed RNA polymerase specialized sigma subunit, sigma24 homolog